MIVRTSLGVFDFVFEVCLITNLVSFCIVHDLKMGDIISAVTDAGIVTLHCFGK